MYSSKLFNFVDINYITIEREALVMVYALHKFKHYLLGNMFTFYVNHMALVYLVNKPQVSNRLARWLLLFLEYHFKIIYKLGKSHLWQMHWIDYPIRLNLLEYLNKLVMFTCLLYNLNGYKVCVNTY
jgi:hypothetical protein